MVGLCNAHGNIKISSHFVAQRCGKLKVELESQDGLAAILHLKTTPINPQSLLLFVAKNIQSPNRTENLPFLLFDKNGPNSSKILFQKNVSK